MVLYELVEKLFFLFSWVKFERGDPIIVLARISYLVYKIVAHLLGNYESWEGEEGGPGARAAFCIGRGGSWHIQYIIFKNWLEFNFGIIYLSQISTNSPPCGQCTPGTCTCTSIVYYKHNTNIARLSDLEERRNMTNF